MENLKIASQILGLDTQRVVTLACIGQRTKNNWSHNPYKVHREIFTTGIVPGFVENYCKKVIEDHRQPPLL